MCTGHKPSSSGTESQDHRSKLRVSRVKLAYHDADTDTDILARILARMSASATWNSNFRITVSSMMSID